MLDRFHRAVTSPIRKTTDPEDAYRTLRVLVSAYENAKTGHRVTLKYDD